MGDKRSYQCKACGKTKNVEDQAEGPECCGAPMEELPSCTKTFTGAWARFVDNDEPCDEGNAGKGI
jgi:hypothetical protein